jgi:hypothetical protein
LGITGSLSGPLAEISMSAVQSALESPCAVSIRQHRDTSSQAACRTSVLNRMLGRNANRSAQRLR